MGFLITRTPLGKKRKHKNPSKLSNLNSTHYECKCCDGIINQKVIIRIAINFQVKLMILNSTSFYATKTLVCAMESGDEERNEYNVYDDDER